MPSPRKELLKAQNELQPTSSSSQNHQLPFQTLKQVLPDTSHQDQLLKFPRSNNDRLYKPLEFQSNFMKHGRSNRTAQIANLHIQGVVKTVEVKKVGSDQNQVRNASKLKRQKEEESRERVQSFAQYVDSISKIPRDQLEPPTNHLLESRPSTQKVAELSYSL